MTLLVVTRLMSWVQYLLAHIADLQCNYVYTRIADLGHWSLKDWTFQLETTDQGLIRQGIKKAQMHAVRNMCMSWWHKLEKNLPLARTNTRNRALAKNGIKRTLLCSLCFSPMSEKESLLVVWWLLFWLLSVCAGCQSSKVILVWWVSNFSLQS